jgi:glycosyltransferase involved in cell wall biosynthesis
MKQINDLKMQISILLPHKERFDKNLPSSVVITIKNNLFKSKFNKNIKIYGKKVDTPISKENFFGVEDTIIFRSKNKNLANVMCKDILKSKHKDHIIEIHNRPYLFKLIYKKLKKHHICIFFHNDPQHMKGSIKIEERLNLLKNSKMIYCVSKYIKRRFLEGIEGKFTNIKVLYNGVDRKINKMPKKNREVIFVGRLVPEKGIHIYIDAIEKIFEKFPLWKFSVIGSPYLGSSSKDTQFAKNQYTKFKKIGKQAHFTGFLNPEKVCQKMEKASIIVIPSLWEEPFGLVVAEAMANGIAIIASKVGGIPEIIEKNGILIKDISAEKLAKELSKMMTNNLNIVKYQKLAWQNFKLSSNASSMKLDKYREQILENSK